MPVSVEVYVTATTFALQYVIRHSTLTNLDHYNQHGRAPTELIISELRY